MAYEFNVSNDVFRVQINSVNINLAGKYLTVDVDKINTSTFDRVQHTYQLAGDEFMALAIEPAPAGSMYDSLKAAIWQWLMATYKDQISFDRGLQEGEVIPVWTEV